MTPSSVEDPSTDSRPIGSVEWALAALVPTVAACVALTALRAPARLAGVPVIGAYLADTDKMWVVLAVLLAAIASLVGLVVTRRTAIRRGPGWVISALSVVGLLLAVLLGAWQDPPWTDLWTGFGPVVLGVAALGAVGLIALVHKVGLPRRLLLIASLISSIPLALVPLLQTRWSFRISYDNAFTLNEILAPAAGRLPGFDFVALYETLLGLPLALAAKIAPGPFAEAPESIAVYWVIGLQLLTLAAAIVSTMLVSPRRFRWMVPLIIIPITYLIGGDGAYYYADLPFRFVLPALLLMTIVLTHRGARVRWWSALAVGAVSGLVAFNNLDFGVPAAVAALIAISVRSLHVRSALSTVGVAILGMIAAPAAYIGIAVASGKEFHPSYLLFFVREFAVAGFGQVDMPTFGLHISYLAIGVVGLVLGVLGARRLRGRMSLLHVALVFESLWLLLSFVYYSGRSLVPTLITGSSFPAALVVASLVVSAMSAAPGLMRRPRRVTFATVSQAAMTVLIVAIPIAAWSAYPGWAAPLSRIADPPAGARSIPGYLEPDPRVPLQQIDRAELIGLLSKSGSEWSLRTGVPDASLLVHPFYVSLPVGAALQCEYLDDLGGTELLTTRNAVASLETSEACRDRFDFDSVRLLGEIAADPNSYLDEDRWVVLTRRG